MNLLCVRCGKTLEEHWTAGHDYLYLPDNCQVCRGAKGGVLGNENIIEGVVICDYCTVLYRDGKIDLGLYEKTR